MMSPQETPRLESCPFCANTRAAVRPFGDGLFAVHCRGLCECVGPLAASEADAIEAWNRRLSSSSGEPTDGEKWSFARKCVQRGYDICVQQPDDDAQGLASLDATAADLVKHNWPTPTSSLQEDSPSGRKPPRLVLCGNCGATYDANRDEASHGTGKCGSSGPEPVGEHPEDTCELCGRQNVTWFAPSPLWNDAIRKPQGKDYRDYMLCPVCFIKAAESIGVGGDGAWRVAPSDYTGPDDDPRIRPEPAGETVETEATPRVHLSPAQELAVAEYLRDMEEDVIPAVVETLRRRALLAIELRSRPVFARIDTEQQLYDAWRKRAAEAEAEVEKVATALRVAKTELRTVTDHLDHIAQNNFTFEYEDGGAWVGWYDGIPAANGQDTLIACIEAARERVWNGGVMRPEFQAKVDTARAHQRALEEQRDAVRSAVLDARREIAAFRFQPAGEHWPDMIERDFVLDVLDRVGGQER